MILSKKKKPAAASSVVSGEALGMDANNAAMLVKERNANNAWHKLARNKRAPLASSSSLLAGSHRCICPTHRAI